MTKTEPIKQSNLSLANRKQLSDMLTSKPESLRQRALDAYSKQHDVLEHQAIDEYAIKEGVVAILAEIAELESKLETRRALVKSKGLRIEDGRFDTYYETPTEVERFIETQVEGKIGSRSDIHRRFDDAQVKLMTIGTLDEARELIESLLKNEPLLK